MALADISDDITAGCPRWKAHSIYKRWVFISPICQACSSDVGHTGAKLTINKERFLFDPG